MMATSSTVLLICFGVRTNTFTPLLVVITLRRSAVALSTRVAGLALDDDMLAARH